MPIPEFEPSGALPPGIHDATVSEVQSRFGMTPHRARLFGGLVGAMRSLKDAGCRVVYLDGSFVSAKEKPDDFDACWEEAGVDRAKLDPILLKFDNHRAAQKTKFHGELFPASNLAELKRGLNFIEFFQRNRDDTPKGIVRMDLAGWTP